MIRTYQHNSTIFPSSRKSISVFSYAIFAPFSVSDSTGKELDEETGYGYFGARYYDPTLLTGWTAVDPMADKYPSLSPYNYCAWNPMKLVDPDGRDIWELNNDGELIWKESTNTDEIRAKNGKSVQVKDGVLQRGDSYTKNNKYMCLQFGDDMQNATEVFEFLADNTENVEFSFLGMASSMESELSSSFVVGTSYEKEGDSYSSKGAEYMAKEGRLRQWNHNHPSGKLYPSNNKNNKFFTTGSSVGNDAATADDIDMLMKNAGCKYKCSFAIYVKQHGGEYKPYHTYNDKIYKSSINKNDSYYK